MMRRFAGTPSFIFVVVVLWKLALLAFTAQPIPLSDSFFYDGAVVNWLNGGGYCNPSLELVLPISGTKVFSAYPPLYQGVLCGWMSVFGSSVLSAMWLHFVLFVLYGLSVLAVVRELNAPARWVNCGSLFLFGITFQDRPDSLALACGCWALYGWLRAGRTLSRIRHNAWHGLAATLNVLTLATSPQIGMAFLGWSWLMVLTECRIGRRPAPWSGLAASVVVPAVLVLAVSGGAPLLWQGFREHVGQTPSLMGWHVENAFGLFKSQLLKLVRTAPGIIFAGVCFAWFCACAGRDIRSLLSCRGTMFLATALVASGCLIFGATVLLMPNVIHWLAWLQPLIVALTLGLFERVGIRPRVSLWLTRIFLLLALVVAIRAVGISSWGVACAVDSGAEKSLRRVRQAIASASRGSTIVLSSAYLYEANRHREVRSLHADWLASYRRPVNLTRKLAEVRPTKLVLTQFDWYRRYEPVIAELRELRDVVRVEVTNTARLRPPDSYPRLQRILQHVSWSPVLVELDWKKTPNFSMTNSSR